ncbi:MAG: hypothetical protein WC454_09195, partial [Phycisphaerae bacterium]
EVRELAELVGFTFLRIDTVKVMGKPVSASRWLNPDKEDVPLPNFPNDMNAFGKWVMPVLIAKGIEVISSFYEKNSIACDLAPCGSAGATVEAHGKTEAEARCLAALKYLREVKK